MNCPSDGTTLLMSERQNVEIDYCPECRGIWLDRGELDKILERAKTELDDFAPPPAAPRQQPRYDDRRQGYDDRRRDSQYDDRRYGKKKKSPFDFLGDIFEG